MDLKTRPPTGKVPWPLVLLEGGEKVGKSWACAVFSACDRIGQMYWIDFAEGSGDEYGAIPGARYQMVPHDGTWSSFLTAVKFARAQAQAAVDAQQPPVVLVIDTMGAEWDLLKDWATNRARGSDRGRATLARDPNAEVVVTTNYWNDANARHRQLMKLLMTFPGIVLMTARGKEVAAIGDDGKPIEGQKKYSVEAHKNLGFDSSCWIRLFREEPGIVVGMRSVFHGVRPGKDKPKPLPEDWTLEWLIFDALKCDPATAHVRELIDPKAERTPEQIRDEALRPETGPDRIRELYHEAKPDLAVLVSNEAQEEEMLGVLLIRIGKARMKADDAAHKRMHVLWRQAGFEKDRDGRIAFTAEIVKREIESSDELTGEEAELVIARLTAYVKNNQPPAEPQHQRDLEGATR